MQLAKWRKAKELNIPILDITAKSGISAFAPDFVVVIDYKNKMIDEFRYTDIYLKKMRNSFATDKDQWLKLLDYDSVALACYCPANTFCHRHIFAKLFEKYLNSEKYTPIQMGELI